MCRSTFPGERGPHSACIGALLLGLQQPTSVWPRASRRRKDPRRQRPATRRPSPIARPLWRSPTASRTPRADLPRRGAGKSSPLGGLRGASTVAVSVASTIPGRVEAELASASDKANLYPHRGHFNRFPAVTEAGTLRRTRHSLHWMVRGMAALRAGSSPANLWRCQVQGVAGALCRMFTTRPLPIS